MADRQADAAGTGKVVAARPVVWLVRGQAASDGAGVRLTRVIGTEALPDIDPFLMLDEFGSDDPSAYIAGFPDHPHRGFETVTYMLTGRMRHRDNQGNSGLLGPGSVQWMTAGRGIVHSEMPEQQAGLMRGFQLWINLPARLKMTAPRYQDIAASAIPVVTGEALEVKVIAGSFQDARGPVDAPATEPLYLDVALGPRGRIDTPVAPTHAVCAYVYEGTAEIGPAEQSCTVSRGELAILGAGEGFAAESGSGGRLLLLAGRPLREPIVKYGPFVMNTPNEIRQAIVDYQAGRL